MSDTRCCITTLWW